jgi:hypothetical protein
MNKPPSDGFKIWKSDLQGLVEEAKGPIYLMGASRSTHAQLPMVQYYVAAAGFNAEGRVCELQIQQPPVMSHFQEMTRPVFEKNQQVFDEIKARLAGLGREVRDGLVSTQPLDGVL